MMNLLLPPLYQQHYYAQPQPQLYQPLPSPPSNSSHVKTVQSTRLENRTISEENLQQSDQIQNESPFAVSQTVEEPETSTDTAISKDATTITIDEPIEPTNMPTEKQLEFKPVLKKTQERHKSYQK